MSDYIGEVINFKQKSTEINLKKKELKPCPFCGCTAIYYVTSITSYEGHLHEGTTKYHYSCRDCEAFGPLDENVENARMLWNSRAGAA